MLDRDGVLNIDRLDSVRHPDELVLLPGAAAAVGRLNAAGVAVALVTNQAVVGRGVITPAMLDRIHDKLAAELARAAARLDRIYVATDAPEAATARRKPGPGMLIEALADFACAPAEAVLVGDAASDRAAAIAAGTGFALVRTGKGAATERMLHGADDLAAFDDLETAVAALIDDARAFDDAP